jgi:hypothetical protein
MKEQTLQQLQCVLEILKTGISWAVIAAVVIAGVVATVTLFRQKKAPSPGKDWNDMAQKISTYGLAADLLLLVAGVFTVTLPKPYCEPADSIIGFAIGSGIGMIIFWAYHNKKNGGDDEARN